MGVFCLLVELHREGSAPAAGLFLKLWRTAAQEWVIIEVF